MPEISTTFRVDGADQFTRAVRDMETQARRFGSTVQTTFQPAQTAVRSLTSALSAFSTIVRLTGNENDDLARKMESFTLVVASAALAVQSLRGASAGLAAALAILRVGVATVITGLAVLGAALLGPFGLVLAASVALGVALGLLGEKTGFAARSTRELVDAQKSLASVSLALTQQTERQLAGEGQSVETLQKKYKEFTDKQRQLAEAASDRRFQDAVRLLDQWADAQEAAANTIQSTTARLATLVGIKEQTIERLQQLARSTAVSKDHFDQIQAAIRSTSNELTRLNAEGTQAAGGWRILADALGGVQRLVEQGVAAGIELAKVLRKESDETAFANQLAQERAARLRETAAQIAAYRDALNDASRAQEDWNRQNAFDARQQGEVEEGFRRRETALQRSVALMDNAVAQRRAEVAGLQELTVAIQAEVAALEREIAAKIAAGIPTEELVKSTQRLRDALGEIQHRSALAARALDQALGEPARRMAQNLSDAFQRSFEDMLQNARTVGEGIVGFFQSVVNSLISMFARLAAQRVFEWLLGIFSPVPFAPGFNVPVRAPIVTAQHGMIVDRPTLALMGEGGERELALPERFWPALGRGGREAPRPREAIIHLTIHNVIGDPRAIGIPTAGDAVNAVVNDITRRGPTMVAVRAALP